MKMKIMPLFLLVFIIGGCSTIKKQIELAGQKPVKFKVDMKSPKVPIGKVESQLEGMFSGLKKVVITVSYSPYEDAVCLEFKRNTITNYQYFSRENRTAFLKALDNYTEDFDGRKLVNNKNTKFQYGKSEGYLIWKLTKVSDQKYGNLDFSFGYLFKEGSPFFTITQGAVTYENIFARRKSEKYSRNGEFQLFFTRAQSVELAAFFDQQFLRGLSNLTPETFDPNIVYESY